MISTDRHLDTYQKYETALGRFLPLSIFALCTWHCKKVLLFEFGFDKSYLSHVDLNIARRAIIQRICDVPDVNRPCLFIVFIIPTSYIKSGPSQNFPRRFFWKLSRSYRISTILNSLLNSKEPNWTKYLCQANSSKNHLRKYRVHRAAWYLILIYNLHISKCEKIIIFFHSVWLPRNYITLGVILNLLAQTPFFEGIFSEFLVCINKLYIKNYAPNKIQRDHTSFFSDREILSQWSISWTKNSEESNRFPAVPY